MFILATNDDGIHAPGLTTLVAALEKVAEVVVVAPDRERSASGHALTLHAPLRADEIRPGYYAVDGTPTDCVNLGIHGLFERRPDLVVSGINRGANMGDDITYSGTVSAAMEATLMGVPAFAVSLACESPYPDFSAAGEFAGRLARYVSARGLPPDTFLNVNVPELPAEQVKPVRVTRQGKRVYGDLVIENIDPRGRKYYWIGAGELGFRDLEGTDFHCVHRGHISITPLHMDLTNYRSLEEIGTWDLPQS